MALGELPFHRFREHAQYRAWLHGVVVRSRAAYSLERCHLVCASTPAAAALPATSHVRSFTLNSPYE
jgi:hypothetical protein